MGEVNLDFATCVRTLSNPDAYPSAVALAACGLAMMSIARADDIDLQQAFVMQKLLRMAAHELDAKENTSDTVRMRWLEQHPGWLRSMGAVGWVCHGDRHPMGLGVPAFDDMRKAIDWAMAWEQGDG